LPFVAPASRRLLAVDVVAALFIPPVFDAALDFVAAAFRRAPLNLFFAFAAPSSVFVAPPLLAVRRDFQHRRTAVEVALARVAPGVSFTSPLEI